MSDPENKREQLAAEIHEVYRTTARALGWPMRPEVDVPYEQLSEAAKELDRAFADYVLDHRARERERGAAVAASFALPPEEAEKWVRDRRTTDDPGYRAECCAVLREHELAVKIAAAIREGR